MIIESCQNALWAAAIKDDLQLAQDSIARGADIFKFNEKGWNSLILSSYNHSKNVLTWLLDNGGDVNATNHNGTTLFMYAKTKCAGTSNYEILDMLLSRGADINRRDLKNGWTVLRYAEELGDQELIGYLIANGAES